MTKGPNSDLRDRDDRLTQLFLRAKTGDRDVYRDLLEELMEILGRHYARILGKWGDHEPAQIEDLVQETLLAVHEKRGTFDSSQRLGPWMFAIARYKLVDWIRRRAKEKPAADWARLEESLSLEAEMAVNLSGEDIEALLNSLPEKQRELIRMVKIEGLSVREASKKAGISETALKTSVHRALESLKLKVRREFE